MKKSEIRVGGVYLAKVSDKITRVRVDAIRESWHPVYSICKMYYDVTNLTTGRKTTFRSAAKFRSEVKQAGFEADAAKHFQGTIPGGITYEQS